jgi:acyl-coenzyme A synthetase/AMP-(fatty) acid ligase
MATTDPTFDTDNAFATLVDFWLHDTSNRTYAILADPHESTAIRVSFQDFARAAHNFGRWLQSHVKAGEVVGQVLLVTTLAATTATVGTARAGCAVRQMKFPRVSVS